MIMIYSPENQNFDMNGDILLNCTSCLANFNLGGSWTLSLESVIDNRIVENAVISVDTIFGRKQLYRIHNVDKDEDYVKCEAYPIFLDARHDCFIFDKRPTNKNGQEALNELMNGTKYSAESDIAKVETAYYINKNLIEAINGDDSNSFINRWGGEPAYLNYHLVMNQRLGSDKGAKAEFGYNLTGVRETVDSSKVVTRIVPVAYNGRMLPNEETVDSDIINSYPVVHYRKIEYSNIRLLEDIDENSNMSDSSIIVYDTKDELYEALRQRAREEYEVNDIDKPKIKYDVNIVDLSKFEEYKDLKNLVSLNLGDDVLCRHRKLGINTKARVIELTYDCLLQEVESLVLGDYQPSFFDNANTILNSVDKVINVSESTLYAEKIAGIIDLMQTSLRYQKTIAQKQDVRAILFEDTDEESPTYGALCIGTQGLQIAKERKLDDSDWNWGTAIDSNSIYAQYIIGGVLSDISGTNVWDLDHGVFTMNSGVIEIVNNDVIELSESDNNKLLGYFKNEIELTDEELKFYDLDGDGDVSAADLVILRRIINAGGTVHQRKTIKINTFDSKDGFIVEYDMPEIDTHFISKMNGRKISTTYIEGSSLRLNSGEFSAYLNAGILSIRDRGHNITLGISSFYSENPEEREYYPSLLFSGPRHYLRVGASNTKDVIPVDINNREIRSSEFGAYFENYTTTNLLKVRRIGNQVFLHGIVTNKYNISETLQADKNAIICTLPEVYRPSENTEAILCQGSEAYKFIVRAEKNGKVYLDRYTNDYNLRQAFDSGAWLNINAWWFVD